MTIKKEGKLDKIIRLRRHLIRDMKKILITDPKERELGLIAAKQRENLEKIRKYKEKFDEKDMSTFILYKKWRAFL